MALKYHPDRLQNVPKYEEQRAKEKFHEIQEAYENIMDRHKLPKMNEPSSTSRKRPNAHTDKMYKKYRDHTDHEDFKDYATYNSGYETFTRGNYRDSGFVGIGFLVNVATYSFDPIRLWFQLWQPIIVLLLSSKLKTKYAKFNYIPCKDKTRVKVTTMVKLLEVCQRLQMLQCIQFYLPQCSASTIFISLRQ